MQFLFDENAGANELCIRGEGFYHLKVRRVRQNESLKVRNLKDDFIYVYKISSLNKNSCLLNLQEKLLNSSILPQKITLALGVIEPKILEKTLPILNELGLYKLILVFTHFSQRNFRLDFRRLERILIKSCEQCGRANLMQIECFDSTKDFANAYENAVMLDFSGENSDFSEFKGDDKILFIGAEGGFTDEERSLFKKKIKLKSPYILKSQSAIISVAAKILL